MENLPRVCVLCPVLLTPAIGTHSPFWALLSIGSVAKISRHPQRSDLLCVCVCEKEGGSITQPAAFNLRLLYDPSKTGSRLNSQSTTPESCVADNPQSPIHSQQRLIARGFPFPTWDRCLPHTHTHPHPTSHQPWHLRPNTPRNRWAAQLKQLPFASSE